MKMKKIFSLLLIAAMSISCFAACGDENEANVTPTPEPTKTVATQTPTPTPVSDTGVTAAKDYLNTMYASSDGSATATASDYTVVGVVKIDGVTYNVTWSVDVTKGVTVGTMDSKKMVTIDVDEKTTTQIDYNLTATVSDANGNSKSVSFAHFVPAYKELTWAEYAAAADDTTVVVNGTITGIIAKSKGNSSNCIYFQDSDGGYYIYNLSQDPVSDLGLAIGMTIRATGTRDTYSGTYEITGASVEIVDSTIKTVAATDYTDKYTKAESLKDSSLTEKQGLLVTLKGVEIIGQGSDTTYYMFELAGKQSYIRLSSSVCPITSDEQTAFKTEFLSHIGYTADVTGILTLYDGAFYLSPVDSNCLANLQLPNRSDAEKAAFEIEKLGIPTKVQEDTELTLPRKGSTYSDVSLIYNVTGNASFSDAGALIIKQGENATTVNIEVTATCGAETKTEKFVINVEAKATDLCTAEVLSKLAALESGESISGTQVLQGKVTEIVTAYSESYNNITVNMDVNGTTIQCFRLVGGSDLAVGDVITVTGTLKNYKGTLEFDKGCTYSKTLSVEQAKQEVLIAQIAALEAGETMSGTQVLSGKITEIVTAYSESYNNITVNMDVSGTTIQCYRLVGGSDLAVGDVITVTGTIKNYKGTLEFDKGCTYIKGQNLASAKDALVMEKAYALESGETLAGIQEITGEIVSIDTAYSESYNNITVTLKVGDKTIVAYRLTGGSDLAVGDVITVTGTITNYKGTVEFTKGCTYVVGSADKTPATGDMSTMIMVMLMIMIAGSFVMMMISKKKEAR